jgi:putative ABC transport system substrate-binding protein
VAGGVIAAPLAAEAERAGRVYRIGFLGNTNTTLPARSLDAFRHGLRELGWVEGQNVAIEYRWADGHFDRLPALAADLVKALVDVIVVAGPAGVRAALQATRTVPIVAAIMGDPVVAGFVTSFARPGGNVTGSAVQFEDLVTKQLQLLKETVPKAARVAILHHTPPTPPFSRRPKRPLGHSDSRDACSRSARCPTSRARSEPQRPNTPTPYTFCPHRRSVVNGRASPSWP